ncbi:xanthine dehydrogenase accessory protein XdhC [Thioclava sp. GXIMD2076]|uniref:xanthine dehydrogenase accessory protein XdhC n=1 Tax=unclassified Thioclava TaxID=2621713 RepID=UPI0030D34B15
MSFDPTRLREAATRGPFTRVLVVGVKGSTPRETGAEMLVFASHIEGTIGGGALEYAAIKAARAGRTGRHSIPLGPAMNQCCGGAVTLAYEAITAQDLDRSFGPLHARRLDGPAEMPLSVHRALSRHRDRGQVPQLLVDGWLVEPVAPPALPVWIWGAGHVGRAIAATLAPFPDYAIHLADTDATRFPATLPQGVTPLIAENPADLVPLAPCHAHHYVLTYSHALDLDLCHRLLTHGFGHLGLIGSETKWARFRGRLRDLGHSAEKIGQIQCPIGDPSLGKHPQAIAIGVAAGVLRQETTIRSKPDSQDAREA